VPSILYWATTASCHAAFFGTGAYIGAWTAKALMLTPELAILCGGAAGGILGVAFGFLAIRRQGLDFAMITLALAQMTYFFYLQAPFTNGEDGIQKVPRGDAFGLVSLEPDMTMYWFVSAIFLGGFAFIYRVIHSPFGNVLKGIRENETRASSLGYRANTYKLIAFGLSAFLAAIAGATKTHVFGIATLSDVSLETSSLVLLMALLGGKGTIFGPVVGAVLVVTMESKLATIGSWVMIAQGIVFIACVLLFRRGIVGEINRGLRTSL
jgi:branched-chain amino acid transport system permease protein